jgi:hypothetical protein
MAELHGIGVAAVFAADAELDAGARLAALGDGDLHELADAGLVNGGERIFLHDLRLLIGAEEAAGIVAAHAEAGLREVVRAEAEELRRLRDLVGRQRAARNFDHRADAVGDLHLLLLLHLRGDFVDDGDLQIQFLLEADERDHDFGLGLDPFSWCIGGGFEHGARLHAGDFRDT